MLIEHFILNSELTLTWINQGKCVSTAETRQEQRTQKRLHVFALVSAAKFCSQTSQLCMNTGVLPAAAENEVMGPS